MDPVLGVICLNLTVINNLWTKWADFYTTGNANFLFSSLYQA
jgi:hypothetical protein